MDWIDKSATNCADGDSPAVKKTKRSANLEKLVSAALAQPVDVWGTGFEHSLANLKWPAGCDAQATWLWSTLIHEQAEVLLQAGISPRRIAQIVRDAEPAEDNAPSASAESGTSEPLEIKLFEWLNQSDAYPHAALGVIVTAWQVTDHAQRIDADTLSRWIREVTRQVVERQSQQGECLLGNLVYHCELPLLLELFSASPRPTAGDAASQAMDALAEYLENSEEHVEAWLAHGASYLRAALASVLRCRVLADHLKLRRWYPPQRKALAGLLKHAARWARPDGTQMLGYSGTSNASAAIWKALVKLASDSRSLRSTMILSGLLEGDRKLARDDSQGKLVETAHQSDHAKCATMRHAWDRRGCLIAIDFSESMPQIETLGPKGVQLAKGEWPVQVALDGQIQCQMDGWDPVCWFSDQDVDYLEIESRFGELVRVQRQVILFRQPRLMMVADALLSDRPGNWTMKSELPLAPSIEFELTEKNTEGFLVGKDVRCLVVPLFLPEWRSAPRSGSLTSESETVKDSEVNKLVIRNSTQGGTSMFSPVIIGLNHRAANKPYTWRQLTVGDNLNIARRDQAAAFRFQTHNKQYLLYRSLTPTSRRTVLGVHLQCDFYAGTFDKDSGEANTLVEIDANAQT